MEPDAWGTQSYLELGEMGEGVDQVMNCAADGKDMPISHEIDRVPGEIKGDLTGDLVDLVVLLDGL